MSRFGQKPSEAKQRDAELAQVEAELKVARAQLDSVNAEIKRSKMILVSMSVPELDPAPEEDEFDRHLDGFPFPMHSGRRGSSGDESPA